LVGGVARNYWLKRASIRRDILRYDFKGLLAGGAFLTLSIFMGAALYYINDLGLIGGFFSLAAVIGISAIIYLPSALFCGKIITKR